MNIELDLNDIKARIRPALDSLKVFNDANAENQHQPVAAAIADDAMLALFFVFVVDFVGATPTAVVSGDAIEQLEGGLVRMVLPIPQMFDSYYQMRLAKLAAGEMVMPGDQIETPMVAVADGPTIVIAADAGEDPNG